MVKKLANPTRFDIFLVNLDPTVGTEIKKTRPCIIVSPNELNHFLSTVIIAPMTSTIRNYPTRINLTFKEKKGQIVLDQIRTIDHIRLVKKIGTLQNSLQKKTLLLLQEIFKD